MYKAYYDSEIGIIEITASEQGIKTLEFVETVGEGNQQGNEHIEKCIKELKDYFCGELKRFSVKLDWNGTEFQEKVWNYLLTIPFGKTVSYNQIAIALGDKKAVRAVGTANGRNNIAIIVPCHRVIGSDGKLTGYAYGIWRKEWLLKHEGIQNFKTPEQIELF
ncbi:MAG: methylated-DNA--[protein]-cysteine S-methyltransferase [Tenericutes bacterium]|nr:methylated-DNA--[protein]-cysteine S-methyltransferase [Mycoplasmatota bacterium]MBI9009666.1 methylated-DNA--[protein]-cysteine S-methyltransferase [Mycoplasmatota bacterium]